MFRLVYVFDPRQSSGYVARMPVFMARVLTSSRYRTFMLRLSVRLYDRIAFLDYAVSESGI